MSSRIKKHTEWEVQELNLIPVMNLVTILIPFALLSAQFVHLAVIDSSLPAIGQPQIMENPPDKPPLRLTIIMSDAGFTLSGGGAQLPGYPGAYFPPVPEEGAALPPMPVEGEEEKPTFGVVPAGDIMAMCQSGELPDFYVNMSRCFQKFSRGCEFRLDTAGQQVCTDVANATEHPWHMLGGFIEGIKEDYEDEENVILMPEPEMRYVDIVNLMDVSRERNKVGEDGRRQLVPLFPNVVLAGGQSQ
jgi:hypothetical protein